MSGGAWGRRVASIVLVFSLTGCGGDEDEVMCGTETCGAREQCDAEAMPAVCVCKEAYTGDECAACAIGYRPIEGGDCEPVPIDCDADPLICGTFGACTVTVVRGQKLHACECLEGWAGHVCQRCDRGWQDNDGDGVCLPACSTADITCEAPFVCSDADGVARCACPTGYAGDDCTQCARGFHDPLGTGECTATCSTAGLACGEREMCSHASGEPECVCIEGYAGDDCRSCAEGWQDDALPGDCRPSCAVADLDCGEHGACADESGFATCACDPGWAGAGCDTCADGHHGESCEICSSGWYRVGDGPCMPSCGSGAVTCGPAQGCWDGAAGPECTCEVGYAGPDCTACAEGYADDGSGACVAMPPAGYSLVAHGTWRGGAAVVAIDPTTGDVFPLRGMSVSGLAWDPAPGTLYTDVSGGLGVVDLAAGTATWSLSAPSHEAFTYDTMRDALLLFGSSGIYRLSPTTGSYVTLASSGPSSIRDAAYDATADRAFVASAYSSTISLYDVSTGASSGTLTPTLPIDASYGTGIAMTSTGQLWAIGRQRLTADEQAARACRTAARGILGADYASAPVTVVAEPSPGSAVTVSSTLASGPELIVLRSYGSRTAVPAEVRIATTNPDALICIGTYEGVYRIAITAGARFAAVAAESYEATLSATVSSGFPEPTAPNVHVLVRDPMAADPSLFATPTVIRTYSSAEWGSRRINLYGSSTSPAGVLVRLNPSTGAVVSTRSLPGLVPQPSLAPWAP